MSKREEHRQLGCSPGFPRELMTFCDAYALGISRNQLEDLPRDFPYGSCLCPVLLAGETRQIYGRIGKAPEYGRGSRHYTLAQYFVAPPGETLYASDFVGKLTELSGITEHEAQNLSALSVLQSDKSSRFSALTDELCSFIREGLVYLVSGIPITIFGKMEEPEFYSAVEVMRSFLPTIYQSHLSAGWGVSIGKSQQLAISNTSDAWVYTSPISAIFQLSPEEGKKHWSPPKYVFVEKEP